MVLVAQGHPGPARLRRDGIILPVLVTAGGRTRQVDALWDTGSQVTSVDRALLHGMGDHRQGSVAIYTVAGGSSVGDYPATLSLVGGGTGRSHSLAGARLVLGDTLPGRIRVLIGWDIQQHYRMEDDGPAGWWRIWGPSGSAPAPCARYPLGADVAAGVAGAALAAMAVWWR